METVPVYVIEGEEVKEFNCKECGAMLGLIQRRLLNRKWITFLERWGDRIYHGDIYCKCGRMETWTMNQGSYDVLMSNYKESGEAL